MNVLGVVAEFNPFHRGHQYLLTTAKDQSSSDAVICVMSGNFLQRAEPALCDKWSRAEMAIHGGADLVIELPFCFAVRSAYYFARGAVQLLARTGVVTHLGFGSEYGILEPLQNIAAILAHEPDDYQVLLKNLLAQGLSFPAARSRALLQFLDPQSLDYKKILNGPNNILAIEYLHNIMQDHLCLRPLTIPRRGEEYHSQEIAGSGFSSASAIRAALHQKPVITGEIAYSLTKNSQIILEREINARRAPIRPYALEQIILANLRKIPLSSLKDIYEISEGLEYRIKEACFQSGNLEELRQKIKTKRFSLSRIDRILLYTFFNLTKEQIAVFDQHGPQYFHILAFSSKGREILQAIKNKSALTILSRGSQVKRYCQGKVQSVTGDMLALDVLASDIYSLLSPSSEMRRGRRDFLTSPFFSG